MNACKSIELKMYLGMPDSASITRLVPSRHQRCDCDRCNRAKRITLVLTYGKVKHNYRVCRSVAREVAYKVSHEHIPF